MSTLKPVTTEHKSTRTVFVHKDLMTTTHVFVRLDRVKRPLESSYDGPYKVISRNEKFHNLKKW